MILDVFLHDIILMADWTGYWYAHKYVGQINYLVDVSSKATATTQTSTAKPYHLLSGVQTGYPGETYDTSFMDQPTPNSTLGPLQPGEHHDVDWRAAIKDFVGAGSARGDDPVQFFGHTLWYYLSYPLTPCNTFQMAYNSCNKPAYSMIDALTLVAYIAIGLWAVTWLTGISIPMMFKLPALGFAFLVFRYDYVPRCLPVLPLCLVTDIQSLLKSTSRCLCQMVPALVTNPAQCSPDNCPHADNGVNFRSCPTSELGVFDPLVFLLRWRLPMLFQLIFGYAFSWLREEIPTINAYYNDIVHGVPATPLEITCAELRVFDVILVLLVMSVLAKMVVPVARSVTETIISAAGTLSIATPILFFKDEDAT